MGSINAHHTSVAIASMQALREALAQDLAEIENLIQESESPEEFSSTRLDLEEEDLQVYYIARAALFSGLASINEVLGWIHLMAEKDAEGNEPEAVRSLPVIPVWSIN